MTDDELENLLQQVYHVQRPANIVALCELSSLAALASQYLPDRPPLSLRESLFRTATENLNVCIQIDIVRAMRVIACLSIYSIMEHRDIARFSVCKFFFFFFFCFHHEIYADMDKILD